MGTIWRGDRIWQMDVGVTSITVTPTFAGAALAEFEGGSR